MRGQGSGAATIAIDPMVAAWESIRAGLRRDCGARTFDGWLRPIALGGLDAESGALRLELPSQFMADWVQTHFAERLALAWKARLPEVKRIRIQVGPAAPVTAAVVEIPAPPARLRSGFASRPAAAPSRRAPAARHNGSAPNRP